LAGISPGDYAANPPGRARKTSKRTRINDVRRTAALTPTAGRFNFPSYRDQTMTEEQYEQYAEPV
jgi:hypothetical protein